MENWSKSCGVVVFAVASIITAGCSCRHSTATTKATHPTDAEPSTRPASAANEPQPADANSAPAPVENSPKAAEKSGASPAASTGSTAGGGSGSSEARAEPRPSARTEARQASRGESAGGSAGAGEAAALTPSQAHGKAAALRQGARKLAAQGQKAEAFEQTVRAWQLVRRHAGDAACRALAEELQADMAELGEAISAATDKSHVPMRRLRIE